MNKQGTPFELLKIDSEKEGVVIDYKRILFRAIKYWYLCLLSLVTCLTIVYVYNRYAPRVYTVTASMVIKDNEETGDALELLSLNAPHRNYKNELYSIRSYSLIQSVLEELNFGVSFFQEGNILTSEIYGDLPFDVSVINGDQIKNFKCLLILVNDNQYQLGMFTKKSSQFTDLRTFDFNDTIFYNGLKAVFRINKPGRIDKKEKSQLIFSYTSPEYLTGSYVSKLGASWAEIGSGVINLSINGTNPLKDKDFLNGVMRRYREYDLEKKNQTASRTIEFIDSQLDYISDSLRQAEGKMERFKTRYVVTELGKEATRLYEGLQEVELQKTEMAIKENYYQYLVDYVQTGQYLDKVILPSSIGLVDAVMGDLLSNMVASEMELKIMVGRDKVDNPVIRERKQKLQEIKKNILESVKNLRATDGIKLDYINRQIKKIEAQLTDLPTAERQYISINRNYSLLENLYTFLLQKKAEAGISKASTVSSVDILNRPMAGGPISPKAQQNLMFAAILGIAIPFSIFLLMEYLNSNIQSREDIEKTTSIPFIGGVGHKDSPDYMAVLSFPKSEVAESFRALRSNLSYFTQDKKNVVILVSSSISGEGKTFTSINIATVLAFSSKKTLIVGADMRRPKLFGDFKLSNSIGLSSYLAGMSTFADVVQRTTQDNLDLVSSGPVPPNPSELILRPEMAQFFMEARQHYDYIVVDSPPLAIVSDAFVLADYSDHFLFIARQNFTPKNMLRMIDEFYRNGRVKNISILLNDISQSGPGYGYGHRYGYGYGYVGSRGSEYYEEMPNRKSGFWPFKRK